jgi:hypothetical protein
MASKHNLSLEIPDTNNINVFRIFDTSLYVENVGTNCGLLQITAPGFNTPVSIDVLPQFNLVLNACTLGIQTAYCTEYCNPLPDGIYTIRYSVAPNDKVYIEYNYLRLTQTYNKYFNSLAALEIAACEPDVETKDKLKELQLIKGFLDAAKVKVEYSHNPEQGMELLVYAQKRLIKAGGSECYTVN